MTGMKLMKARGATAVGAIERIVQVFASF